MVSLETPSVLVEKTYLKLLWVGIKGIKRIPLVFALHDHGALFGSSLTRSISASVGGAIRVRYKKCPCHKRKRDELWKCREDVQPTGSVLVSPCVFPGNWMDQRG